MRLIDADALKKDLVENYGFFPALVMRAIDKQPTIEAEPVKHGKWIADRYCSNCEYDRKERLFDQYPNYCPNCGADMRGE